MAIINKSDKVDLSVMGLTTTMTIQPNTFRFDGHEFAGGNWGNMPIELAPLFDLAYRARRGDEAAIAVIKSANVYLTDIAGNVYVSRDWKGDQ